MAKRAFDVVASALALLVAAIPMAVIAVVVRLRMGSPVLFRHERPGLHGRPFSLIKFRTMRAGPGSDAERLTRFGEVLRSTSLDELPELWNVLKGEMSLVGPRPLHLHYLELYSPRQARRHEVRPGLTGLAQVSGRNLVTWDERLELDVQYVETRSMALDLKIIWRTIGTVIRRDGISAEGEATMGEFEGEQYVMVIVVGAAGHGREVADVVLAAGLELLGFVDDGEVEMELLLRRAVPLLGGTPEVFGFGSFVVLGVGDGLVRAQLAARLEAVTWVDAIVHPDASIGTDVELGEGSVVAAGARLTTHLDVGRHVYAGPNATIGHDAVLEDFVTVLPGATVSGAVTLGEGSTVGTGANLRQGVTVGPGAVVGAGAVVVADVEADTTVVGVPARPIAR